MMGSDNAGNNRARTAIRRREFLRGVVATTGLASSYLRSQVKLFPADAASVSRAGASSANDTAHKLITANADFFVRNHFQVPTIREQDWSLEIGGSVDSPLKVSYSDLLLAPSVRRSLTLECAGNLSGGAGVSTAVWSGVVLGDLLKQVGVQVGATTVIFHGADSGDGEGVPPGTHFARCIPLEKAMDSSCLLAYEMNGAPLPAEHGFPLRTLVSGWYGMDSVKWLTRVEVSRTPFKGYFQQERYVAVKANGERAAITRMRVSSKFLRPLNDEEICAKSYRIAGLAWAGERKISTVELRFDGNGEWQPVVLDESPVAMVWTPWSFAWSIPRAGQYAIEVRAIDDEGNRQPVVRDRDRKDEYELNTSQRVRVNVRL